VRFSTPIAIILVLSACDGASIHDPARPGDSRPSFSLEGPTACELLNPGDPFFIGASPRTEVLDGADNDCDGLIDNGVLLDEFGNPLHPEIQFAMLAADPEVVLLGETTTVSALVRVTLNTQFASAEYRVGAGEWAPMSYVLVARNASWMPDDARVEATTPPFTAAGQPEICVRATDATGYTQAPVCVTVTVERAQAGGASFVGFFAPLEPGLSPYTERAGRSIPLRFQLLDDGELPISSTAGVELESVVVGELCEVAASGAPQPLRAAGRSGLRFDDEAGRFVFVWETLAEWAGTCRRVRVLHEETVVGEADFIFAG
jgi:hypothetical protein